MKILLVDDDRELREELAVLLGNEGYGVVQAGNPRQAMAIAAEQKPELCLLDYKLPDMDGIQVMKLIKAAHPDCAVILISGHVALAGKIIEENVAHMVAGCLQKPFSISELLLHVKHIAATR